MNIENNPQAQDIVELTKEMKKFDVNNYKNKTDFDRFLIEFKKKEKNYLEQKAKDKEREKSTNKTIKSDEKLINNMPNNAMNNITSLSSLTNQQNNITNSKFKNNTNSEPQSSFIGSIKGNTTKISSSANYKVN